jgi:light-regulated signal transduction histidine kinase (bacteriophytochrome)
VLQKTLSFECENRNLKIKCNRVQFLTLLKNIISNAIKYSALENGVILIKTFVENDHVIITVEDNGNGDFEKVSTIFFSMEQNKLESHMSGMGFKICKEIATNYSIIISFEQSEKLKGIKVVIKI